VAKHFEKNLAHNKKMESNLHLKAAFILVVIQADQHNLLNFEKYHVRKIYRRLEWGIRRKQLYPSYLYNYIQACRTTFPEKTKSESSLGYK
jgi:hypothetical protein